MAILTTSMFQVPPGNNVGSGPHGHGAPTLRQTVSNVVVSND